MSKAAAHCGTEAGMSGEAVGRNPTDWYHCQNSPSGPTILSYRAVGNRQRSKGESENERLCNAFLHGSEAPAKLSRAQILCVAAPAETMNWNICLHKEVSVH